MMDDRIVKAYLLAADGCSEEIRRFSLPPRVSPHSSYNSFVSKISSLFPALGGKTFKLTWKDEDGDYIVMSSDEELSQALSSAPRNTLKIYISCIPASHDQDSQSKTPEDDPLHPNVVCDGCDGQIRGNRYKCLECEDYDLCEACLPRIRHPAHNLMRIVHPDRQTWPFCGKKAWKHYMKWGNTRPGSAEGHFKMHHRHYPGRKHEKRWHSAEGSGQRPFGVETVTTATEQWGEFLRMVGRNVATVLDPFGIDVTVDVERPNRLQESDPKDSEAGSRSQADANMETAPAAEPSQDNPKDSDGDEDWTMVVEGPSNNESNRMEAVDSSAHTSTTPNLDPKVAETVAQLTSMGFNNEGSWLTRLVEAKGGDIVAVLDSLHPTHR